MKKTFFLILLITGTLFAGETGRLIGKITDEDNIPLMGVNIILEGTLHGTATDELGNFSIHNIPASSYNIIFSYIGYKNTIVKNVIINADLTKSLNMELEISAVKGEEVTVLAKRDIIVKDQTATTLIVVQEDINNMPVNSYVDVLTNMSGVVENNNGGGDNGIHIRGGRSGEIAYMVDGIMVEDALFGGMGSDVTRGGISELSVIIGSFNAEYGEAMSGVINIVTREGNNNYDYSFRTITDQFGGYKNNWNSSRYEATFSGPIPMLDKYASFLVSGDKYLTDTRFRNTFLDRDINDFSGNIVYEDLDFDGEDELMENGARMFFDTFKNESRILGKLILRPFDKFKVTLSKNILNTEKRGFSSRYRLYPAYNGKDWVESDLSYINMNYTFNKDIYFNLRYSEFENQNWEGHPEFLNSKHELYSAIWEVPDNWTNTIVEDLYVPAEEFSDINGNGEWNSGENFIDANLNEIWDDQKELEDYVWLSHYAEPFDDLDGNGVYSSNYAEPFDDLNGNGIWNNGETFVDDNNNGNYDTGEPFADLNGDEIYSWGAGQNYYDGDAYGGISNYEYLVESSIYDNNGDSVAIHYPFYDDYENYKSKTNTIHGSLTWQVNPINQLKAGFERKDYKLNFFAMYGLSGGIYGAQNSQSVELWDANPITFSWYIQDKMEFSDLIINLGYRMDHLKPNSLKADPDKPLAFWYDGDEFEDTNGNGIWNENENFTDCQGDGSYNGSGLGNAGDGCSDWGFMSDVDLDNDGIVDTMIFNYPEKAKNKTKFSPRIGIAYPITDNTAFHFSYGQFYQYPDFAYLYWYANSNGYSDIPEGISNIQSELEGIGSNVFGNNMYPFPYDLGDWYIPTVGSPDLEPETTIAYEFGLRTRPTDKYLLSFTVYYKDMYDYIASTVYDADPTEYARFENMDYANSKGFEISLSQLMINNLSWSIAYSFTHAEGNAENEFAHWYEMYYASVYGTFPARKTVVMPWDQPHTFNMNLNYIHPIGVGINIIGNIGSGLPYTPTDSRGRNLDEINSGRMPFTAKFDLKGYYDFEYKNVNIRLFSDISNIFDKKNILNVFNDSGKPDESLDPGTSDIYEFQPGYYGSPRHIEIGIEFSKGGK